jgi:D-galactarolactone cycloisomerase
MSDTVERIECFLVDAPREELYLGRLLPGETIDERGYFVRKANRTIYPVTDRSLIVKLTTNEGRIGWGETYGLVAPAATAALIYDAISPVALGRDPFDNGIIWEDAYDLMRVRGYNGGHYLDAIAAIDIALWDLCGKIAGLPLHKLLGGQRHERIPAYVSGLAAPAQDDRMALARSWVEKGFKAIKLHIPQTPDAIIQEVAALRDAVGPDIGIMLDLHWMFTGPEAVSLLDQLAPYALSFVEAPCKTEDVSGLAWVADHSRIPVAAGEEWRTVWDAKSRLDARACSIVQPEMGHTGITQFMRIARLAEAHHARVAPHATIGCGIFMAASLQASATLLSLPYHEYQPTIFHRNAGLIEGVVECDGGSYTLPTGAGLGVQPSAKLWDYATAL